MIGISELVAILRTEYAKRDGVEEDVLRRNGVLSAEVAAVELRSRGYRVEVSGPRGGAETEALGDARRGRQGTLRRSAVTVLTAVQELDAGRV